MKILILVNRVLRPVFKLQKRMKRYAVTGTFHGSFIYAKSEGDARRAFHTAWNGESIIHIKQVQYILP